MTDYIVLLFLVITYLVFILLASFDHRYIRLATIGFASLYFFWGLWHHKKEKSLHPKVVLEYFIIATLGLWLIIGI